MKKVSSVLFMCVFVIGIVTIFSGLASALIMTVGDPYEGNSWHQRIGLFHSDRFDSIEMFIESEGSFEDQGSYSDYSWNVASFSSKWKLLRGNSVSNLGFEMVMNGDIPEHFSFSILSRLGNILRDRTQFTWNNKTCSWSTSTSVPDANIMWLLGPAFIILGFWGRKKAKKY